MKELSTEQKVKAYDEALSVARKTHQTQPMYRDWLEKMFPELAESEDERIRKEIISMSQTLGKTEWIAWLEKQDELVNSLSKGLDNAHERIDGLIQKNNSLIEQLEKQDEKKPVELKTKAGNWYVCDMEVMNENMATAFHRDEIYYCPKDGYLDVSGALFEVGSLDVFRLATEKEIPQSHWKPSDEQMKILNEVLNFAANHESPHWNDYIFGTLNNFIRQLKKLREE